MTILLSLSYGGIITTMIKTNCKNCGKEIVRGGQRPGVFCSLDCKGAWQREQKPVDKAWLYQKYIVEGLGTYEIGKLVNRDAKRVYEWLIGYGIPTRTKNEAIVAMNKRADTLAKRSRRALGHVLTQEQRAKISKGRQGKHYPKLQGEGNGMFGRRGEKSNNWQGGVTPERQALYSSLEWAEAVKIVWRRDEGTCQRCKTKYAWGMPMFHLHHFVSFAASTELRADPSNLILLCSTCHHWVHSKANTDGEFLHERKG